MTLRPALARLERGFQWCRTKVLAGWRWLKRRFQRNAPGWGSPAKDAAHAYYRTQYERLVETLPNLPRSRGNETNATFLAFAQVVQQLHELGDDPIMPPGIKRIVVRETARMARFGAIGRPSFLARVMGSFAPLLPYVAVAGVLLSVTGWGSSIWNGWRAERLEDQRNEARRYLDRAVQERDGWKEAYQREHAAMIQANLDAAQTAATLEEERRRNRDSRRREQERNRAIQSVIIHNEPPAWRLRDDGEVSERSGSGDASAAGNPSGLPR